MEHILELAEKNQREAWEVIHKTDVMNIWKSVGAEINLVGSLNMGLLVKNRDVDFHIYSSPLTPAGSFMAMAKLAENPFVKRITYKIFWIRKKHVSSGMPGMKTRRTVPGRWI